MELARSWTEQADNWIAWARADGHDSYWNFHRRALLRLLPPPGRLTLDVGCGEGRVARDLAEIGHRVIGFDQSAPMVAAAHSHPQAGLVARADAVALPVAAGAADVVLAFMSVQDMDRPAEAIVEAARVLAPGGWLHLAVVHPINSAGRFEPGPDAQRRPFVIEESYFERRLNRDEIARDGLEMRFDSEHRPLSQYSRWLEEAGFVIEAVREVGDPDPASTWSRVPLFLHLTARKAATKGVDRRLFHIATLADIERLGAVGVLEPPSLVGEGFVHLSQADQVVASTERHFSPDADLVLVELDPERLVDDVRWPEVYPGERFPHLHGPLRNESVVQIHPWGPAARRAWTA